MVVNISAVFPTVPIEADVPPDITVRAVDEYCSVGGVVCEVDFPR